MLLLATNLLGRNRNYAPFANEVARAQGSPVPSPKHTAREAELGFCGLPGHVYTLSHYAACPIGH